MILLKIEFPASFDSFNHEAASQSAKEELFRELGKSLPDVKDYLRICQMHIHNSPQYTQETWNRGNVTKPRFFTAPIHVYYDNSCFRPEVELSRLSEILESWIKNHCSLNVEVIYHPCIMVEIIVSD